MSANCQRWASRGFVVFNVDYRLGQFVLCLCFAFCVLWRHLHLHAFVSFTTRVGGPHGDAHRIEAAASGAPF